MARRRPGPRAQRRGGVRRAKALRDDLERLARLEPGGAPEHPIEIHSPVQVETRIQSTPCPLCEDRLTLDEHAAASVAGRRLRIARCHCFACGTAREIYFRLRDPLQS